MERIGTLRALRRYPVKSMAGEDLAEARVTYAGLAGDRVHAFVDTRNQSDFPWMTGRQGREMVLFRPRFLAAPATDDGQPDTERFATEVTTPEGETFRVDDPLFAQHLEKRFNRSLRLRFSERSMTDACPVSVLSYATIQALGTETGMTLDPRRFRANFYVQWEDDRPFFEDDLVGRSLQIGETVGVQVVKKDSRCVMITLDPETAQPAKQVLETVSRKHGGCTGVYGAVLREGIVRVNDPVYLV
jgi:uncharacterized protein YcbX